jgi:hypothetical protein
MLNYIKLPEANPQKKDRKARYYHYFQGAQKNITILENWILRTSTFLGTMISVYTILV